MLLSRLHSSTSPQIEAPRCGQWGGLCGLLCSSLSRGIHGFSFLLKKIFFLIRRKEEGRRSLTDERANPVENSFCSFQCLPCVIGICLYFPPLFMSSLMAQWVKNPPVILETWVCSPGQEDPLEEEMATHSSVLA